MDRPHQLLSEFTQTFRSIFPNKDTARIIHRLNSGLCYFVADAVGRVLYQEGFIVTFKTHCHHAWINVDGIDYDTLFPTGYTKPVVEEWCLKEMCVNTEVWSHEATFTDLTTTGHCPPYLSYKLVYVLWCQRQGLPIPAAWTEKNFPCKIPQPVGMSGKVFRRLLRRFKKAQSRVFNEEPLPTGLVMPFTQFTWDSVEPNFTRPLKPYPFMRSVTAYKKLFKDLRERGIPVQRM